MSADVVVADFIDECLPIPRGESRYLIYYCRTCWAAKNKFKNPASSFAGSILLFREPYSICYPAFYDLAYIAQGVNAAATVVSTPSNGLVVYLRYHVVPFKPTIPTLAVQHYVGYHMERLVDKGTTVHALVHALENHRGPSFYPPSNFHKALPETDLALTPTSCDGKVSELGTVQGGQSTFNPNAMAAISNVEVVPLRLVRACNRVGGAPKSTDDVTASTGVDCALCLRKISENSALLQPNSSRLVGKIAFIEQWEMFCEQYARHRRHSSQCRCSGA